jgi:hypothetical protein
MSFKDTIHGGGHGEISTEEERSHVPGHPGLHSENPVLKKKYVQLTVKSCLPLCYTVLFNIT